MKKNYFLLLFLMVTTCFYGQSIVDADANKNGSAQASEEIQDFKIYPNPVVNGKLFIQTFDNAEKRVQLFNILGKEVLNTTLRGKELNLSKVESGVYILKVFENEKTSIRKLVVK